MGLGFNASPLLAKPILLEVLAMARITVSLTARVHRGDLAMDFEYVLATTLASLAGSRNSTWLERCQHSRR